MPEWSFPGRGRVQRQLQRATKAMDAVERLTTTLPVRGRQAALAARLEDRNALAKRALGYVELYGAYTETEARYRVDRLLELVGLPRSGRPGGVLLRPGRHRLGPLRPRRPPPVGRRARPGPDDAGAVRGRQAAGPGPQGHPLPRPPPRGLRPRAHADRVERRRHLRLAGQPPPVGRPSGPASSPTCCARRRALLALDRRDRGDFLRSFYRRYEDAPVDRLAEDAWELFHRQLLTRSFPAGLARVREHRRLGHRTLLVTGALDFVIAPLRPLFDDIVCARLGQHDGRYDGRLEELPPIGEARALLLADYAAAHDLSLDESVAYADSASDLAMLEAVGFPVAVNPESRLAAIARRRGWHVEHWAKASGGSHRPLPIGPLDVVRPGGRAAAGHSATGGFATAWAAVSRSYACTTGGAAR